MKAVGKLGENLYYNKYGTFCGDINDVEGDLNPSLQGAIVEHNTNANIS